MKPDRALNYKDHKDNGSKTTTPQTGNKRAKAPHGSGSGRTRAQGMSEQKPSRVGPPKSGQNEMRKDNPWATMNRSRQTRGEQIAGCGEPSAKRPRNTDPAGSSNSRCTFDRRQLGEQHGRSLIVDLVENQQVFFEISDRTDQNGLSGPPTHEPHQADEPKGQMWRSVGSQDDPMHRYRCAQDRQLYSFQAGKLPQKGRANSW